MNLLFPSGASSLMPHPSNPLRTPSDYKVGQTRGSRPVTNTLFTVCAAICRCLEI
jgi:hypothetical protein